MKLDCLSKILIATGQINYMAASIYEVNQQMKVMPDENQIFKEGIQFKDQLLNDIVNRLANIMEDMGNLINDHDCISPIDERVSKVPFEIIIHGKDDSEELYDEKD